MWGTIRAKVRKPVRDKVWVSFAKDSAGWAYLFYERIGRICTFCGVMFHSVQHCTARNSLLMSRSRLQISLEQISPNRFGQWITSVGLIPGHSGANFQEDLTSFSSFLNPQLARLQKQFMEDSKGKDKVSEGVQDNDNYKKLSLKEINEHIRRMEGPSSSTNPELQIAQKQNVSNIVIPSSSVSDLGHQTSPNNQLLLGQGCTRTQHPPAIPLSSSLHTSCQHDLANLLPHSNISNVPTQSAAHITQAPPISAIHATLIDKHLSGSTNINPIHTRIVSSSPPSPLRSNPKRPSESLLGVPLPPAKKVIPHGARENSDKIPGSAALSPIPNSGSQALQSSSLLGAPPSRPLLLGQPSPAGGLGSALEAFAGDGVQPA